MLAITSIKDAGWFSQKYEAYMFSRGVLELCIEFYMHTVLPSEWRARWWTWTKIGSKFFASQPLWQTWDKSVTYAVCASPSSVPRINHLCSHFFLTLGCSIYSLWFMFVFDAMDQTQSLVRAQQVLDHWAPWPAWFYCFDLHVVLFDKSSYYVT